MEFPCLRARSKSKAKVLKRQIENIKRILFWPIHLILHRPNSCLQMLRRQAVEILFKVLFWFVTKIGLRKNLKSLLPWRELVAINFALKAFDNHLAGQTVACNTDNQSVFRIIQAGSMVKELQDISLNIFPFPPNAKFTSISPGWRVIRILRLIFLVRLLILTAIILSTTRCFSKPLGSTFS